MVREGFIEEVTLAQRPKGDEGANHEGTWAFESEGGVSTKVLRWGSARSMQDAARRRV